MEIHKESFDIRRVSLNIYIRVLAFSDSFIWLGYFLFISIVALHLRERLGMSPVVPITIGTGLYLFFRAIVQLPVSKYLDRNESNKDEIYAITLGGILVSLSFFGYIFVWQAITLYLINILFGIGVGIYLPAMRKTYARYIDKGKEGFYFAFGDFMFSFVGAIGAITGGLIVTLTGSYVFLFLFSAIISLIGAIAPLFIFDKVG